MSRVANCDFKRVVQLFEALRLPIGLRQFVEDLLDVPMLGGPGRLDVTRGREVVVVLLDLFDRHDADEPLHIAARVEGVGGLPDAVLGKEVLRPPLLELFTRVDQNDPTPALLSLRRVSSGRCQFS